MITSTIVLAGVAGVVLGYLSFRFLRNWGIAIILLTILVKILTLPLTVKQYRSMAGMKKVQPKMKELQARLASVEVYLRKTP